MNNTTINMDCTLELGDYKGRLFVECAFVTKDTSKGPGWYIFAHAKPGIGKDCYGGHVVKLIARPPVAARHHPHYNGKVQRGWKTKLEAQNILAALVRDGLVSE